MKPGFGLAGGERLNERLPACTLIEQLHVEPVLCIDALGKTKADGRMAGRDLGPFQLDRNEIAGDSIARRPCADHPGRGSQGGYARSLDQAAARQALGKNGFRLPAHRMSPREMMEASLSKIDIVYRFYRL